MHFKLLIAFVEEEFTDTVIDAARAAGATGCTVLPRARGEGLKKPRTFLGLTLEIQRDVILLLVEEHLSRDILETIADVGHFEQTGKGIAFQINVEDAVGVVQQVQSLSEVVEEKL